MGDVIKDTGLQGNTLSDDHMTMVSVPLNFRPMAYYKTGMTTPHLRLATLIMVTNVMIVFGELFLEETTEIEQCPESLSFQLQSSLQSFCSIMFNTPFTKV